MFLAARSYLTPPHEGAINSVVAPLARHTFDKTLNDDISCRIGPDITNSRFIWNVKAAERFVCVRGQSNASPRTKVLFWRIEHVLVVNRVCVFRATVAVFLARLVIEFA